MHGRSMMILRCATPWDRHAYCWHIKEVDLGRAKHLGITSRKKSYKNGVFTQFFHHQTFQIPKMEVLNYRSCIWGFCRENPPSKLPYKAQDSCMFWYLKLLAILGNQLVRCTLFCRGCFANIESSSSEPSQMSFSFNIKTTTSPYVGVSLYGGIPKTPQNDHF